MTFRITAVENIEMSDYPDFCDAYCTEAEIFENDEWREATEDEVDLINDKHYDSINEAIHDDCLYL